MVISSTVRVTKPKEIGGWGEVIAPHNRNKSGQIWNYLGTELVNLHQNFW